MRTRSHFGSGCGFVDKGIRYLTFVGGQIVGRRKFLSAIFICVLALSACNGNNSNVQINPGVENSVESNAFTENSDVSQNENKDEGKSEDSLNTDKQDDLENVGETNNMSDKKDNENTDNENSDQSDKKDSVDKDSKDSLSDKDKDDKNGNENLSKEDNASDKDEASKEVEKKPEVIVTDMSEDMYVSSAVNVRIGPSVDEKKIGTLSKDTCVTVTGKTDNGWYRIDYNSQTAFVNCQFLISKDAYEKKKAEEEAALIQAQQAQQAEAERQAELLAQKQAEAQQQAANQSQSADSSSFSSRVVALCNEQRAAYGLGPLTEDATLDSLASVRANEIVGTFDHTRPDGSSCFSVLNGVNYMAAGENIASGQTSPEEVVNAWMNSEGHRANILSADFNKIGVGYLSQGVYGTSWVQLFTN